MKTRFFALVGVLLFAGYVQGATFSLTSWPDARPLLDLSPGAQLVQVVFADAHPHITVRLMSKVLQRDHTDASHDFTNFGAPWWSSLSWVLQNQQSGDHIELRALSLSLLREYTDRPELRKTTHVVSDGEIVYAEFEAPRVPVGSWLLTANLNLPGGGAVSSEAYRFSVRRGDEDIITRRTYLRDQAERIVSVPAADRFDRFKSVILQLAELEPSNPANYEWLGDIAAAVRPARETVDYYARALEITKQTLTARYGMQEQWPTDVQQLWETRQRALTAYARAVAAQPLAADMRISVQNEGGEKTILIYRGSQPRPVSRVQ